MVLPITNQSINQNLWLKSVQISNFIDYRHRRHHHHQRHYYFVKSYYNNKNHVQLIHFLIHSLMLMMMMVTKQILNQSILYDIENIH